MPFHDPTNGTIHGISAVTNEGADFFIMFVNFPDSFYRAV